MGWRRTVTDSAIEVIPETESKVISEKVSYRLAQQPGSHMVLKYVRNIVKCLDTRTILTAAAPSRRGRPPAGGDALQRSGKSRGAACGMGDGRCPPGGGLNGVDKMRRAGARAQRTVVGLPSLGIASRGICRDCLAPREYSWISQLP